MTVKLNLTHRNKKIQFTEKKKYRIKTEAVLRHFGLNILLREEIYSQNNSNIFRFSLCIFMTLQYFILFIQLFYIVHAKHQETFIVKRLLGDRIFFFTFEH